MVLKNIRVLFIEALLNSFGDRTEKLNSAHQNRSMFFLLQQCRIPDNRHFHALKLLYVPPTYIIIMVYITAVYDFLQGNDF